MNIWDEAQKPIKRETPKETPQERHNRKERERYHSNEELRLRRREYNRRYIAKHPRKNKQQKLIDRVCMWMQYHLPYGASFCDENIVEGRPIEDIISELRKAMEV